MAVEARLEVELLPFRRAIERARELEAAGAELLDPYPEVTPTAVEDKLLYLSSSIYGRVIPVPLFYFERNGHAYILSYRLHRDVARLLNDDVKVLFIYTRDPAYPFTAISMVLYDVGVKKQNEDFIKKYVCPEVREITDGRVPLADEIRRALRRYLSVKPAADVVETLRCLCGLCDNAREFNAQELVAKIKTLKTAAKTNVEVDERLSGILKLLNEVEKMLMLRVIKGFSMPGFKDELEELLKRYGI